MPRNAGSHVDSSPGPAHPSRTAATTDALPAGRRGTIMAYILNTTDDVRAMLATIGLDSLDQLFEMVPSEFRRDRPLAVPGALSELELTEHVAALAARNRGADRFPCFLGGGCYDHFIPAVVDALAGRGEFFTASTPD